MNILFTAVFLICTALLLFNAPEAFLPALIDGAGKSATLCLSLLATYALWMGLMRVWEDSGVARGISRLLKPVARKLFRTDDDEALGAVCMNLSVNLLGISGATTPYGVKAAKLLDKTPEAEYASAMFFVLNATSLQLFPASIVAMLTSMHSANPTSIILPTLFTTLFSTLLGCTLTFLFIRPKSKSKQPVSAPKILKTKGVSMR
ncbi:MAG: hypothetical protein IJZ32_03340 [Clostridia bacterium]|nr:hypothetical protein [Clostridia bacterium]